VEATAVSPNAIRRYREVLRSARDLTDAEVTAELLAAASGAKGPLREAADYPGRTRWRARDMRGARWARIYLWIEGTTVVDVEAPHGQHAGIQATRENRHHPGARLLTPAPKHADLAESQPGAGNATPVRKGRPR
jgi:hypothetical protein